MAFIINTLELLPISTIGIVLTLALLYEYWRFSRSAPDTSFFPGTVNATQVGGQ